MGAPSFTKARDYLVSLNWSKVIGETLIIVVGVFVGIQASNWNEERIGKRQTEQMLVQLGPELRIQLAFFDSARTYYGITRRYADTTFAAWNGDPAVSDRQFVIAAYQASQIYGIGINAENWTLTFGGEQLRNIEDPAIRRNLELVLTQDYNAVSFDAVATPYREIVRRLIPIRTQDRIRKACGDRQIDTDEGYLIELPPTCTIALDPEETRIAVAALRSRKDLTQELAWHLAAVAVYLDNAAGLEIPMRSLYSSLQAL